MGTDYNRLSYIGGFPPPPHRSGVYNSELGGRYARAAPCPPPQRSSVYERDQLYGGVDCYEKYRAGPYGSSYFEDRHMSYVPPPPPPPPTLSKIPTIVNPFKRQHLPPTSSAGAYFARDRSPVRAAPVSTAGYTCERTRLSPVTASSTSYAATATPQPKDYVSRYSTY